MADLTQRLLESIDRHRNERDGARASRGLRWTDMAPSVSLLCHMDETFIEINIMKLYHFTSLHHLHGIGRFGLTIGDVPTDIDRWKGRVGLWLTSDETARGHGLERATDKSR